jgi:hypothetical protein
VAGGDLTVTFNANGNFTLDRDNLVDATVFGDTQRVYLTHTGATVNNPFRVIGEKRAAKRTKEQAALQREAVRQLYNKITTLTEAWAAEMAAAEVAGTTTSEMISNLAAAMRDVEREEAQEKAEWLLDQHLTDEQRKTWAKSRYIQIPGKDANTYRIDRDGRVSVWALSKAGKWTQRGEFCMYSTDQTMPIADKILATKMYLEANEEGYLKEANYSGTGTGYGFRKLQTNGELKPPKRSNHLLDPNYFFVPYLNTNEVRFQLLNDATTNTTDET